MNMPHRENHTEYADNLNEIAELLAAGLTGWNLTSIGASAAVAIGRLDAARL
jgi:hypothetical protein